MPYSIPEQQNGGIGVSLIHGEDKFLARSSTVLIGLPPALGYLPFTSIGKFSYATWVRRCPVSCVSSTQIFGGKNKNNMKRTNGVRAAYDAFLLRELQVAFGYAVIVNTSKEAYPWPLIVLSHCCLASFAEVP